jgi:uncharacterized protein (TIGR02598 family)
MKTLKTHRTARTQGFSLPEVTMAVAISALGLTSILGLVPNSLDNLKKAGDIATESRINQQIVASVSTAEWVDPKGNDTLAATFDKRRYYYDDVAVEIDGSKAGANISYIAEVEIPTSNVKLASEDTEATSDPYLRRVKVKLANAAFKDFDFNNAKPNRYRAYTSLVTRAGK